MQIEMALVAERHRAHPPPDGLAFPLAPSTTSQPCSGPQRRRRAEPQGHRGMRLQRGAGMAALCTGYTPRRLLVFEASNDFIKRSLASTA